MEEDACERRMKKRKKGMKKRRENFLVPFMRTHAGEEEGDVRAGRVREIRGEKERKRSKFFIDFNF